MPPLPKGELASEVRERKNNEEALAKRVESLQESLSGDNEKAQKQIETLTETVGKQKEAAKKLEKKVRVVSMPCMELFEKQSEEYKKSVFTEGTPILGVEAGAVHGNC